MNLLVHNLAEKVANRLHVELERHGLQIVPTEFGRGLATINARREGDVICACSGLYYDSMEKLQNMLSSEGNKVLCDRLVAVKGVMEGGSILYGALVGCAGYVQHYAGLRKGGPNAYVRANAAKGCSDKLLEIVVKTRNGQGIAEKQLVCLNYGGNYDFTVISSIEGCDSEPEAKKFKGALDKYLIVPDAGETGKLVEEEKKPPAPVEEEKKKLKAEDGGAPEVKEEQSNREEGGRGAAKSFDVGRRGQRDEVISFNRLSKRWLTSLEMSLSNFDSVT